MTSAKSLKFPVAPGSLELAKREDIHSLEYIIKMLKIGKANLN